MWQIWFPDRGARELLTLLQLADRTPWIDGRYRALVLDRLSSVGYYALVLKYWKKHRAEVEADVATWAETSRALISVGRKAEARQLLASWRRRRGVSMWMITNYVQTLSPVRRKQLQELLATCRDALATLPHDHCARYLAHVQAETQVLLGDQHGFRNTWNQYRSYFDCSEVAGEWFETGRKYLLTEVPMMSRYLQEGQLAMLQKGRRSWRWKHISDLILTRWRAAGVARVPWWTWLLVLWIVLQTLLRTQ
jgi:hypothetical protein